MYLSVKENKFTGQKLITQNKCRPAGGAARLEPGTAPTCRNLMHQKHKIV